MLFVFGLEKEEEDKKRIIPVTRSTYSPDVYVMNNKLVKYIFPTHSNTILQDYVKENVLSPIKVYPIYYGQKESIPTFDDVLVEFLLHSKLIKLKGTSKSLLYTDRTLDLFYDIIESILINGFKNLVRNKIAFNTEIKTRNISLKKGDDPEILTALVNFYIYINQKMLIRLEIEKANENETLYDLIINYLDTFSLSKSPKMAAKIEIGFYDITTEQFNSLCEFKHIDLDINLGSKTKIRNLMFNPISIFGNVSDSGIETIEMKIKKKLLIFRKNLKIE